MWLFRNSWIFTLTYKCIKDRGCGRQEQPQFQGAAAAGRRRAERSYSTFKVRKGGVRRYPSSKVRSSGCALLEQP